MMGPSKKLIYLPWYYLYYENRSRCHVSTTVPFSWVDGKYHFRYEYPWLKTDTVSYIGVAGEACVYLGPLEDTFQAKDMPAVLQGGHRLAFKVTQADVTFICCV